MKYYVNKDLVLGPHQVRTYVEDFKQSDELKRLKRLEDYYHGRNQGITNRQIKNNTNNKLISGFPRYICTMTSGYFTGSSDSITYNFPKDNEEVKDNFAYNDESAVTTTISLNMAIYGYAVEQYYIDKEGNFRFKCISPMNTVLLFEDNIEEDLCGVIKFREYPYKDEMGRDVTKQVIEYYTADLYREYVFFNDAFQSNIVKESVNVFDDVPFTYYENVDRLGDFENVISLIDAYDGIMSDNADLFNYYNDCYLVCKSFSMDDSVNLKQLKGLEIPADGDVFYLTKPQVSGDIVSFMEELRKDIHKFSFTVDLTDKEYLTAPSGTALLLKMQGLEFLTSLKESKVKKGLLRRLEIFSHFKALSNSDFEFHKAVIVFKRNSIQPLTEILDAALKLKGIISEETLLSRIPDIDVEDEMKKLKKEKEQNVIDFNVPNPANPNDFYNKAHKEEVEEDESNE